ncbi:hypothetical protein [Nocardia sp. CC227C]|uniref:hypothetical protein n=1 Tax=Nocardia sp. CC227C TaxID=3044562 RepID=UPI00278C17DD|nr:hypothetical protein [Nocardia sp. CC227C]
MLSKRSWRLRIGRGPSAIGVPQGFSDGAVIAALLCEIGSDATWYHPGGRIVPMRAAIVGTIVL